MRPFPWAEAMRFGLGVLRLNPRDFWAMTPRELAAAWQAFAPQRTAPPSRARLDDLMTAFPDKETDNGR